MAKQIVKGSGDTQLATKISKKVHSMLKSHCAQEGGKMRDFTEAGLILVLNKSKTQVEKILDDFDKGVIA